MLFYSKQYLPICYFTIFIFCILSSKATNPDTLLLYKINTHTPDNTPTHPIAILSMRKQANFNYRPAKKSFMFSLSNGNIMLAPVSIYYPIRQPDINYLQSLPWHYRVSNNVESKKEFLHADAVLRLINMQFGYSFNNKHELQVKIRSCYLSTGAKPFSIINNDSFIEQFHSNIKGGEDPFSRKIYGFDKAIIKYTSVNNKTFELQKNSYIIPGIEISYFYYPNSNTKHGKKLYYNAGTHVGINTTNFNTSADIALSASVMTPLLIKNYKIVALSVSTTATCHQIIKQNNATHIYNQNFNSIAHGCIAYKWFTLKNNIAQAISLTYMVQTPYKQGYKHYNNYGSLIFEGNRYTSHWHKTGSHLFRAAETWGLIYTITYKKFSWSVYFNEDLNVNNAPDTQTGLCINYSIYK